MASSLLHMDLRASEVRVRWKEGVEGDRLRYRQSQELVRQTADAEADTGAIEHNKQGVQKALALSCRGHNPALSPSLHKQS